MAKYQTRQRQILLAFLEKNIDRVFTAQEIASALSDCGISQSAVYRNLADLEQEGRIRKGATSETHEITYQYIDSEKCRNQIHLSCKKCGKTYHASPDGAKLLTGLLKQTEDFDLDRCETVLFGVCKACKNDGDSE